MGNIPRPPPRHRRRRRLQGDWAAVEGTALHTAPAHRALRVGPRPVAAGRADDDVHLRRSDHHGGMLQIKLPLAVQVAPRGSSPGPALAVATLTIENDQLYNNINEYSNILQPIQLPFAMPLPVLHFTASRRLMGRFRLPADARDHHDARAARDGDQRVPAIQFFDGMSAVVVATVCRRLLLWRLCCDGGHLKALAASSAAAPPMATATTSSSTSVRRRRRRAVGHDEERAGAAAKAAATAAVTAARRRRGRDDDGEAARGARRVREYRHGVVPDGDGIDRLRLRDAAVGGHGSEAAAERHQRPCANVRRSCRDASAVPAPRRRESSTTGSRTGRAELVRDQSRDPCVVAQPRVLLHHRVCRPARRRPWC